MTVSTPTVIQLLVHSRRKRQEHLVTFKELRDAIKFLAGMVDKFAGTSPKVG